MSRARPWEIWLVDFGEPVGSEQGGRRPAVVVASDLHSRFPLAMTLVLPLTSRDRGLPHHIRVTSASSGLDRPSFARTEEITAVSERRMIGGRPLGHVDREEAARIREMLHKMIA